MNNISTSVSNAQLTQVPCTSSSDDGLTYLQEEAISFTYDIPTSVSNAQLTQVPCTSSFNDDMGYPQEEVISFTYSPPNDLQVYEISYKEIPSFDLVSQLFSNNNNNYSNYSNNLLHEFHFLKYDEKKCYKVTCELIPHSSIVQYLNKNIHGIEQEKQQEYVEFSRELKENLEYYLIQFLMSK